MSWKRTRTTSTGKLLLGVVVLLARIDWTKHLPGGHAPA